MDVKDKMRYFNEYVFHQEIERINAVRYENNERPIMTSQARYLHAQFLEQLNVNVTVTDTEKANNVQAVDKAGGKAMMLALNAVLAEVNNGQPVMVNTDRYQNDYVKSFSELTGFNSEKYVKNPVLPLSPYDERFSGRAVFLKNGSRLLYVKGEDIDTYGTSFDDNMELYRMQKGKLRNVGPSLTADDLSGMSMLMRYISNKDYNAVSNWVNKVGEKDPSKYIYYKHYKMKALSILSNLMKNRVKLKLV